MPLADPTLPVARQRLLNLLSHTPSPPRLQNNPDLAGKAGSPLELWEHWLLLGQFQGRTHRFSCPVQMGTTYRIAYLRARGGSCFDHNYYLRHNPDLRAAGMTSSSELYGHYTYFGQFEERAVK